MLFTEGTAEEERERQKGEEVHDLVQKLIDE
jgi:hypothetical protein